MEDNHKGSIFSDFAVRFTIVFNIDSENDIVLVEAFCVVIHTFIGKARLSAPGWRRWSF